ncbi:DNA repair protein RecN [Proteiniclasticum sp. SCR006]|uniref:DNA repair protein RecN n=1 Tax=Proteiniclasticum aestuarii TaxID=2817862 RepID=A0A939H9F6_9CLOT|nr:DNA repair protein RecN [Proteiniclasticum aestuarii]MBO1263525.1 DNA repair protein RecN [Proteiniclasticum aestuarii]
MLIQLNVKNFALIDHLELNFQNGFTILTGETGAGKSILIDSINFVLGEKFNKEFIRTGADSTFVEAIFTLEEGTEEILDALGIPYEDTVILSRESFVSGRNNARINGKSVLVGVLKEIGRELLDIHGQHNNQNLLDNTRHMDYLDSFIDLYETDEFRAYTSEFTRLSELKNTLQKLLGSKDREKLMDYLKFQIDDIEKAKLTLDEEQELIEKFSMISHAEKISTGLVQTCELMGSEEGILNHLSTSLHSLKSIEKYFEKLKGPIENLEGAYYTLQESFREITDYKDSVYYDQDELNEINERLYTYGNYKKKYGEKVEDILAYYEKIRGEYENLVNAEEFIIKVRKDIEDARKILKKIGARLHERRIEGGRKLSEKINRELKFVGLEKAQFQVDVVDAEGIHALGTDEVNFLISTNTGEPMKPLEKIVSGGELSRIMLSMKVAFIDKDKTPSVIFDEIDTGISGRIAEAVGEKMYSLSHSFQVFCVTHLPQIAAFSDQHFVVSKHEDNKRTFTQVESADLGAKTVELAKMIGGSTISDPQMRSAEDIIAKTEEIKKKYTLKK